MPKNQTVYTVQVDISKEKLEDFLKCINRRILDEEDEKITLEECQQKPELMAYICDSAVEDGAAMYDPSDFMANDGWCDVRDYR